MSLTMDRMCGFLSVVCEQSNTSELPSINWKRKNSAIMLNKWQANSYTTLMIKQMTSFSTFFVTKLDSGCVYVKYEWEGGNLSGCLNNEMTAPMAEFWNRGSPAHGKSSLGSFQIWLPLFSMSRARRYVVRTPKDLLPWHSTKSKCCWTHGQELWCIKHSEFS